MGFYYRTPKQYRTIRCVPAMNYFWTPCGFGLFRLLFSIIVDKEEVCLMRCPSVSLSPLLVWGHSIHCIFFLWLEKSLLTCYINASAHGRHSKGMAPHREYWRELVTCHHCPSWPGAWPSICLCQASLCRSRTQHLLIAPRQMGFLSAGEQPAGRHHPT